MKHEALEKIFNTVLDAVFPWRCVGCSKLGDVLCNTCRARFVFEKNTTCPFCIQQGFFGSACEKCAPYTNIQQVFALSSYAYPIARNIVHECKYHYVEKCGYIMGELLYERFFSLAILPKNDNAIILPIPLHKKRFLERGFNQAELIALSFSSHVQIEVRTDILVRSVFRKSQVDVPKHKRLENVKNIFKIQNGEMLQNKKIVLIDDVMTSGATLKEAARVLVEYQPQSIVAYVFARG